MAGIRLLLESGLRRVGGERGQGTVEYVGLILLVSLLMGGMVAAMKGFNGSRAKGCHRSLGGTEHGGYASFVI